MTINEQLKLGNIITVNIPQGETRFTTNGVDFEEALKNFQSEMPNGVNASDYVRLNEDGKPECKVDWGNGPEWVSGDVITQIRGQEPLYMFSPIAKKVIDSSDWATVENGQAGEMYKPAQTEIKAVEYTKDNLKEILREFGIGNAIEHAGTYVTLDENAEPVVCSLEKNREGQPLGVGTVLLEGGANHELYTNREKDFLKKSPELSSKADDKLESSTIDNADENLLKEDFEAQDNEQNDNNNYDSWDDDLE